MLIIVVKFTLRWAVVCKIYFIIAFIFTQFKDIFGKTSTELVLVSHCPYRMAIKAKKREEETPWSEEKYFGMVIIVPVYFLILLERFKTNCPAV